MAVPFARAASPGPTVSGRANSEQAPPPLIATATSPVIRPHGCAAPNKPQPSESRRQRLRWSATSRGTSSSASRDTHSPSAGVTEQGASASIGVLLHDFLEQRAFLQRAFIDRDAKSRSARRPDMAVLDPEIRLRHQRIGADDAETEDELAGGHHVLGRPAGIEMRAGSSFELREHGKPAAIDPQIGGFGDG